MRKILLWFFLFCIIWVSQSFAISNGTYSHTGTTNYVVVSWDNIKLYNASWTVLTDRTLPTGHMATAKALLIDSITPPAPNPNNSFWVWYINSSAWIVFYAPSAWGWNSSIYAGFNPFTQIRKFSSWPWNNYYCVFWASNYCMNLTPTWGAVNSSSYTYNTGASLSFSWQILYRDLILTSWPQLECSTETIPDTQIINIQPTSTWSIAEYIENPTEKEYWYATSLSWDNPLLVSLLNANNVSWWGEFSYQTWSVSFNSPLSGITSLILSSSSNIEYIKLLWWYWKHTLITYQEDSKTIKNIYDDVNLNDWDEGFGFPVGWSPLVVIQFGYSFFTKNIDTLEVYSIWADDTKEVEICYNEDDDEYFVDWETYTWNPYTDLVWEPEPTEVSFTSSWYLFYENWFCLSGFLPFPSGGDLLFDIKNPLGKITTTYPLKNTWLYRYWIGTCAKITTNYHEQAWQYYVKWRYIYKWVSYDIHPNFFSYTITKPESIPSDINPWLNDSPTACGVSDDEEWFLPWVSRFFACISETISMFFKNQYEAVKKIGSLIYEISDIFTTEVENPFAFLIPQASASEPLSWVMTVFDRPENFAETPFWKIEKLMWGAFAIVSLIVVLSLIIMIKSD